MKERVGSQSHTAPTKSPFWSVDRQVSRDRACRLRTHTSRRPLALRFLPRSLFPLRYPTRLGQHGGRTKRGLTAMACHAWVPAARCACPRIFGFWICHLRMSVGTYPTHDAVEPVWSQANSCIRCTRIQRPCTRSTSNIMLLNLSTV